MLNVTYHALQEWAVFSPGFVMLNRTSDTPSKSSNGICISVRPETSNALKLQAQNAKYKLEDLRVSAQLS